MAIKKTLWSNHDGQEIQHITITNGFMELSLSNFGCTVISIMVPGDNGTFDNMVLGYDSPEGYLNDPYYRGSIVGRFANRISNAAFKLGQTTYRLTANEANTVNHLHGGDIGFNKKIFVLSDESFQKDHNAVEFYYRSPNGEEGYPGNLEVFITYRLTDKDEVIIEYKASTYQTTPVNLTSHCYFNLSGAKTIATDHELFINADSVLVADDHHIPTGEAQLIKRTNLDFTSHRSINNHEKNNFDGYNDCFLLNHSNNDRDIKAVLTDPVSRRTMIVKTTLPGMMLYTGDHLGAPFIKNQGICLETQFFPDSPNQPHFPETLLHAGELYQHTTIYQFN